MGTQQHTDVTIIGAGLTGLSLAWFLKKKGKDVIVVEKESGCGGVIQTISKQGFCFETGPNTGLVSNQAVDDLLTDMSDLCTPEGARPESKKRWIWKSGKWHSLPSNPIAGIFTPLFSLADKCRIWAEPFRKKGDDPFESVAEMVRRRLGKSYLEYAVDPFVSGVYAGDPEYLVTKYALPKLYALEQNFGSFIRGSIKRGKELKQERLKRKRSGIFSIEGGMHRLIEALADKCGTKNILNSCEGTILERKGEFYLVKTNQHGKPVEVISKSVITTVGPGALEALLPFVDQRIMRQIKNLEYAKIIQVAVGFTKWEGIPLNAYGGLIPSVEKRQSLGILFPSSIFKHRAPEGGAMLSLFLGGFRKPELLDMSDEQIINLVLGEIEQTLKYQRPKPDMISIHRYTNAIPQYGRSSKERLEAIGQLEQQYKGLYLAGNIRDGIGMADRVKQAKMIADEIGD